MEKEITITVILDGFRPDYIDHTDFMKDISSLDICYTSISQEPFGFTSTAPAFLSGVYPKTAGTCFAFMYSPKTSPFRFLKIFKIARLMRVAGKNKRVERFFRKLLHTISSVVGDMIVIQPEMVEYNLLQYFAFSAANPAIPTLFNIFDEHNKKWAYFRMDINKKSGRGRFMTPKNVMKKLSEDTYDYISIYIPNTDWIGHKYGPDSEEIINAIKKIDDYLKNLYVSLKSKYKIVNMILFADHGMVEIKNCVDIWDHLQKLRFEMGRDYVVFLDSTVARFWFRNNDAKKDIIAMLSKIDNGRILTDEDYERYKIKFEDNRFGDLMWLADPKTLIFPNFFQWDEAARGMHGYDPSYPDNQGLFMMILNKDIELEKRDIVHLTDIFPSILDIMDLPVPKTCEGISIIKRNVSNGYINEEKNV